MAESRDTAIASDPADGGPSFRHPVRPASPPHRADRAAGRPAPSRVIAVDAHFDTGGTWAGVEQLIAMAYRDLARAGDVQAIDEHQIELHRVLTTSRDRIPARYLCLTDTAGAAERSRFYAVDRAYRLVHGLVGLVLRWKRSLQEGGRWNIRVKHLDAAGHLATRFFTELARRAAGAIDILGDNRAGPVEARPRITVAEIEALDAAADRPVDDLFERGYPALLAEQRRRGDGLAAARTALKAFIMLNSYGYYHEARNILGLALPHFDAIVGDDEVSRIYYVSKMNICMVMTNDPEAALRIVGDLASAYLTKPHLLANLNYILGMHHLRYAEAKDIRRAEHHILQAVEIIRNAKADADPWQNPFQKVFIDNGLAFVRARQGRHQEAIALCEAGYDFLTKELGEDRHRLHRSVLQYNIAQVHVMLGRIDDGLTHYRRAIAMDPHYSEYHNETGNLLQDKGEYAEAIACYGRAIRCSAPYPEVYFNKAVCHARQGELDEALRCFDITLDLEPAQPQAYAFRADVLRELERHDEAIEGYDTAVARGADSPELRVNRAVLHYNAGAFGLALADIDHVIAADPREATHYENRAAIHQAMAREDLARQDLDRAARCSRAA